MKMNMIQAINHTLDYEMARDDRVVTFGEDVGKNGGVFRATDGLQDKYGGERVFDTPLSEHGIIGMACGWALYGMRPIAEIQFVDFIFTGFDQITSDIAKFRYRSGGQYSVPLVIRTPTGGGVRGGMYHSQSPEALFAHIAGLKVVMPSSPADTKGLLLSSIRDPDPVMFLEPKILYRDPKLMEDVDEGDFTVAIGKARVVQEGDDCVIFSWGAMVPLSLEAAAKARDEKGWSVGVVDLRTISPWDVETVINSFKKVGRAVIVHEAPRNIGFGGEVSATIMERATDYIEAPVVRVCGYDIPNSFAHDKTHLPSVPRVMEALERVITY